MDNPTACLLSFLNFPSAIFSSQCGCSLIGISIRKFQLVLAFAILFFLTFSIYLAKARVRCKLHA